METAAPRNTSQTGLRCKAGLKLTVSESQVFKEVPYHPCLSEEGPTWAKGTTPPTGPQEVQPGSLMKGSQSSIRGLNPTLSSAVSASQPVTEVVDCVVGSRLTALE